MCSPRQYQPFHFQPQPVEDKDAACTATHVLLAGGYAAHIPTELATGCRLRDGPTPWLLCGLGFGRNGPLATCSRVELQQPTLPALPPCATLCHPPVIHMMCYVHIVEHEHEWNMSGTCQVVPAVCAPTTPPSCLCRAIRVGAPEAEVPPVHAQAAGGVRVAPSRYRPCHVCPLGFACACQG